MVNREGTVKVLQVVHRGKTSLCHARLDLPQGLPSYMHEDHAEKKCHTGDTFKRLIIKVDTEVAKDNGTMASRTITRVSSSWTGLEAISTMTS